MPLASLGRRLAALLYEALLLAALVLAAGFVLAPLVSPGRAGSAMLAVPSTIGRVISFVGLWVLGAVYFGWSWSRARRTLPMKTWRLALVTRDGDPLTCGQALLRYGATFVGPALALVVYLLLAPHGVGWLAWPLPFINWLAALVDPQRQFLHDRIAGTRLVAC